MHSARPILLVEDNPSQAKLMMRAFDKAGVGSRIFHVSNGEQVLGYMSGLGRYSDRSKFPMPALIVLDLRLPDFQGIQLLNVMRAQPASKRIPVVVCSGSADDKMIAAAYDAGANSYIPKSGDFKHLSEVVSAMVHYWLDVNHVPDAPRAISLGARRA